jgi:hypothetical protein
VANPANLTSAPIYVYGPCPSIQDVGVSVGYMVNQSSGMYNGAAGSANSPHIRSF